MDEAGKWVVLSKQTNPNDFYVKVDGADHYEAYWAVLAKTKEEATELALEVAEELVLGESEIISADQFSPELISNTEILEKVTDTFSKLNESDQIQLGAWVSSKGGLW